MGTLVPALKRRAGGKSSRWDWECKMARGEHRSWPTERTPHYTTMLLALDVGYSDDHSALAGGVLMVDHRDPAPSRTITKKIAHVSDYIPGSFYLRELPCLLEVLQAITDPVSILIIDG